MRKTRVFHDFVFFSRKEKNILGAKLTHRVAFPRKERKQKLQGGSGGGNPPLKSWKKTQNGSERKKSVGWRGSGFQKIVQPPLEERKGEAEGGWGVQLRVGHLILNPRTFRRWQGCSRTLKVRNLESLIHDRQRSGMVWKWSR